MIPPQLQNWRIESQGCGEVDRGVVGGQNDIRPDGTCVRIEVLDTGIGIPPDQLEAVFTEFYQVDNGRKRRADGAGLGLPLTRHLAPRMGGSIEVVSRVGIGSLFTLRLPAAEA